MKVEEWQRLTGYGCRGIIKAEGLWNKGMVKVERKWRNCRYIMLMGWKNSLKIPKRVIRICKLKENRQYSGLKNYEKMTSNDL